MTVTKGASVGRGCCGGPTTQRNSAPSVRAASASTTDTGGPGTKLKQIFASVGAPFCPACEIMANKMDEWGVAGCLIRVDDIVADILPRALAWQAEQLGWVGKLIPETVTAASISVLVRRAISAAIPKIKKKRQLKPHPKMRPQITVNGTRPKFDGKPVRNLVMHIWPTRNGAWQWNLDEVLKRIDLFNGKRVIGIATDTGSCSADEVKDYVSGLGFEFVVKPNNPKLGEMVTFVPCLDRVASTDRNEVTFRCHAKGSKYTDFGKPSHSVKRWAQAMYATCLDDWPLIEAAMNAHAMAGPFKRGHGLNVPFHYSGSFYWFAHDPVFRRGWQNAPQTYAGAEIWPAKVCLASEAACIFHDNAGNVYDLKEWESRIQPELDRWKIESEKRNANS